MLYSSLLHHYFKKKNGGATIKNAPLGPKV
jgi:hypothetical protein